MMHKNLHHVYIAKQDGSVAIFPVSQHVLSFKQTQEHAHTTPAITEKKSWVFSWRRRMNVAALALLFVTSSIGAVNAHIGGTLSYFRDIETSLGNFFGAALLDFAVADSVYARTITATTTPLIIPVMTPTSGSLDILYRVTAAQTGGVTALCNALDLNATTSPFIFSGGLLSASTTATTTTGTWQFGLTLATTTGFVHGDICEVDLIYRGWHPSAPEYTGFTDEEKVHLVITYEAAPNDADVVLNEFLPNPDISANGLNLGTDSDSKPLGEWVELYNKGPVPVDVANWYMTDASGGGGNTHAVIGPSNTNTGATIIPSHGWIVVYMNKATLGNANAEEIHLYTDDNVEVDFVAYDNPSDYCTNDITQGTANISSSTASGVPGNGPSADCAQNQVAENKSYARFPDGTGPWYDPVPTPGYWNVVLPSDPLLETPSEDTPANEPVVEEDVEETPTEPQIPVEETLTPSEETAPEPVVENFSPSGGSIPETPQEESQPEPENSSPGERVIEEPVEEEQVEAPPAEEQETGQAELPAEGPTETAPESPAEETPSIEIPTSEFVPEPPSESPPALSTEPPPVSE